MGEEITKIAQFECNALVAIETVVCVQLIFKNCMKAISVPDCSSSQVSPKQISLDEASRQVARK